MSNYAHTGDLIFNRSIPEPNSGCWIWLGASSCGYGHIRYENKLWTAHRLSYVISFGQIPDESVIHHKCENRSCVNPRHLECMTYASNTAIGPALINSARTRRKESCEYGHKLTDDNLYLKPGNRRVCRECSRESVRRSRAKKRFGIV